MRDAALTDQTALIGQSFGPSAWIAIDQDMITRFGDITQDDQFIHMDPERASKTDLGGTIAHGFLTLSLGSRFVYDCFAPLPGQRMGLNYGMDKLRFITPVRPGDRVRGHFVLNAVAPRGADGLMRTYQMTVEIDGQDNPALVADWLELIVF